MKTQIKKGLILIAAVLFLLLGVLGLFLPILQGLLFIAIGLILLSIISPKARTWVEHLTRRFPKPHAFVEKLEEKIRRWIGESPRS